MPLCPLILYKKDKDNLLDVVLFILTMAGNACNSASVMCPIFIHSVYSSSSAITL